MLVLICIGFTWLARHLLVTGMVIATACVSSWHAAQSETDLRVNELLGVGRTSLQVQAVHTFCKFH